MFRGVRRLDRYWDEQNEEKDTRRRFPEDSTMNAGLLKGCSSLNTVGLTIKQSDGLVVSTRLHWRIMIQYSRVSCSYSVILQPTLSRSVTHSVFDPLNN